MNRPLWNPFRCDTGDLPVEALLPAKLIALCLLLTNHVALLQTPFLPFLGFLDSLLPAEMFLRLLQGSFVVSALALLFNRKPRWAALALGATILLAVVSSRTYYGNNKLFCGLFLLLAGLSAREGVPWLLRAQVVIVYFGAAINKSFDPDWWSGRFFEFWAIERLRHSLYIAAAGLFPPLMLSKLMGWLTIAIEWSLAVGFAMPRLYCWAIWLGVLFHTGMLLFTGSTFTMFFYAMTASYLAFSVWPRQQMLVIFDGDCGICTRTKNFLERLDWEKRFRWTPYQSGAGEAYGISKQQASERLYLVIPADERRQHPVIASGFEAFQKMLLYSPLFYFTLALLLALPGSLDPLVRQLIAVAAIAFFFPLFSPVGEAVYRLVARNRHRFPLKDRCAVE